MTVIERRLFDLSRDVVLWRYVTDGTKLLQIVAVMNVDMPGMPRSVKPASVKVADCSERPPTAGEVEGLPWRAARSLLRTHVVEVEAHAE